MSAGARAALKVQIPVVVVTSFLLSIGYAVQREVWLVMQERHLQLVLVGWDGAAWLAWPMAAPLMLFLIRRYPLSRGLIRRNIVRLAVGSIGLFLVITNLRFALRVLPGLWDMDVQHAPVDWADYAATELVLLPLDFLIYCGFFSTTFAIDYHFKHRQRTEEALRLQVRTAKLESDLALAELQALRGQLHPHFLFNSFNAVTTLVRQHRNDAAVEVIAELGMLLRLTIDRTGRQELSLSDEVEFIRRYLQIEWIRFGEKLVLDITIDPAAADARVPNLLLQPLVENAIKHGISRRRDPGTVRVAARRSGDRLWVEIENDGPEEAPAAASGTPGGIPPRRGIGLTNTRARLDKIYGDDYRLDMLPRADGGMLVSLDLPWRLVRTGVS